VDSSLRASGAWTGHEVSVDRVEFCERLPTIDKEYGNPFFVEELVALGLGVSTKPGSASGSGFSSATPHQRPWGNGKDTHRGGSWITDAG